MSGLLAAAVLILIVLTGGCSSGSGNVAVGLSPGTAQALDQGQSVTLTAAVAHDSNHEGVTWTLTSGPGALTNMSTTSATYSANGATGTAVVTATSIKNKAKTATLNIAVTAMPSITTTSLPAGTEGTAYSQSITETGGAGTPTFSVSTGSLPAGLTLSSSGAISGTPTGPNQTSSFTVKVTDGSTVTPQSATQPLSITINLPGPPSITTTSLPAGVEGTAYNQTVAATGGLAPLTLTTSTGSLPPGLTMSSAGAITGTPTGPNGTSNFTVKVTDSSNPPQTATQALSIAINLPAPPTISPTTLPGGNVGTPYSQTLTGSSGLAPYSWTVSSGALPAGLGITTGSGTTATISGTPTTQQSNVAFTIQVTDSSNPSQHGTQAYTVTIGAPLPLSITTTSSQLPAGSENVAYTATNLSATGGVAPYTWSVVSPGTGSLPTGMSLSSSGQLSGTPTVSGTFPFTAQVTDSLSATATANLSITISVIPAGCGTGNESILNGQYAFSLGGYTAGTSGIFVGAVGSFTANGSGQITAGTVDTTITFTAENISASGSSYTLGPDYRGCATIAIADYTFTTHFALDSTSHTVGRIEEWEPSTSTTYIASGKILKQATPLPTSVPNGAWVFLDTGFMETVQTPPVWGRSATIGGVTVQNGVYTGGIFYSDAAGTRTGMSAYCSFTSCSFTTPDPTTGRFTASAGGTSLGLVKYLVSATQALELVDTSGVGEWRLQTGSPTLSGTLAYFTSGMQSSKAGTVAGFGLITMSGSTLSFNAYENDAGTWANPAASCGYTIDSNGVATPNGWSCSINSSGKADPIFALTGPNTGFVLIWDSNVSIGEIYPQTSTSINAGTYFAGTEEVTNQNVDTAVGVISLASNGGISGTADRTSLSSPQQANQTLTDTATANANGTFTLGEDPGVAAAGLIVSKSLVIVVDKQGHSYPTILVISTGQ